MSDGEQNWVLSTVLYPNPYCTAQKPSREDLELMRAIDEEYLQHPYYGRRRMTVEMRKKGFFVGQKRVRTAMQLMGPIQQ
jgi:putative transposase